MKVDTKKKSGEKGASLDPDDAVVGGGLFGAGTAKAKKHRFGFFDYNGKRKPVPALLVEYSREGESHTESYTVGNGWKPSADGLRIIPKAGQTGLNDNCKCMLYLKALKNGGGMPKGFISDDISVLDGIVGNLIRLPIESVDDGKDGKDRKPGTVLVFDDVEKAPWDKGKGKSASADDDDEATDDDSESDDEEDDEDEKPKKGAAATKGKKKPADDDHDDDEDEEEEDADEATDDDEEDEDDVEAGVEALISALDDGPLKGYDKIAAAVGAQLKKHPQGKAIAKLVATEKFCAKEKGWSFDKKKKAVALD